MNSSDDTKKYCLGGGMYVQLRIEISKSKWKYVPPNQLTASPLIFKLRCRSFTFLLACASLSSKMDAGNDNNQ